MGEDEVNRILRKVIEGRALRDNVTEKGMVLFNKGFLGSAHGITVEPVSYTHLAERMIFVEDGHIIRDEVTKR